MPCPHPICQREPKGVGVCIVDRDHKKVLLGLERFGKYRGKFNLCAGSVEPEDDGCVVNAALRELREEFKVHFHHLDFDRYFSLGRKYMFRLVMIGTTPVFVGHLDVSTVNVTALTQQMQTAIADESLPGTHKEMEKLGWFPWDEHDTSMAWSRFARIAVAKYLQRTSNSTTRSYKSSYA